MESVTRINRIAPPGCWRKGIIVLLAGLFCHIFPAFSALAVDAGRLIEKDGQYVFVENMDPAKREEFKKRLESMTPEQREEFRKRRQEKAAQ